MLWFQGQPLIVNKVALTSGGQTIGPTSSILAGKQGAKFAGGNVTLVRSGPTKTPTKIAPAPPQSVTSAVPVVSSNQSQPTSLLIKNASGQVTMAALVSARPNGGGNVTSMNQLSPQKFVLRPAVPGPASSASGRQRKSLIFTIIDLVKNFFLKVVSNSFYIKALIKSLISN